MNNLPWHQFLIAALTFMSGFIVAGVVKRFCLKVFAPRLEPHALMLIGRVIFYIILSLFFVTSLHQIGLEVGVLLGAVGIFSVALSFAAKTSASNLVSGLFLLLEHPFKLGDTIAYKSYKGKVTALDLLSTKITTSDKQEVRIPNEGLMKAEVINVSANPIRRGNFTVNLTFEANIKLAKQLVLDIAQTISTIDKTPEPFVYVKALSPQGVVLDIYFFASSAELSNAQSDYQEALLLGFKENNIALWQASYAK